MDKISPIKQRILHFIENQGIRKVDFSEKTQISYSNLKGKSLYSEIGGEQITKILEEYSEISPEWLLLGKGDMLKNRELVTNNINGNGGTVVSNINGKISIKNNKPSPEELLYQREISFLQEKIEMKIREIKLLEREILSFKGILEEVHNIKVETEKSRTLITDLYERKIADLKHTITVLEAQLGLKFNN